MSTIFAPVNNFRNSAICTVRISGNEALACKKYAPAIEKIKPRTAKLVKIYNENGTVLDEAIVIYFNAPNSFTGEDVLEISLHSSEFIVSQFLNLLATIPNFSFAKPGEFCMRAVQNGKISLAKAEAINKLILSESAVQHRFAMAEFNGQTTDYYQKIKTELTKAIALLETYIDFSEDEAISMDFIAQIAEINKNIIAKIQKTIDFAKKNNDFDLSLAIIGKPNVGKSTLFNCLTNTSDAIISQIAGTTRDTIKKNITISGFKIQIVDTAGIRQSQDEIEQIGILRAIEIAKTADVILHLKETEDDDLEVSNYKGEIVDVFVKKDIKSPPKNKVAISAKNADIIELEEKLNEIFKIKLAEISGAGFLCNERQKAILQSTISVLENINFKNEAEIISEHFRQAMHNISHLVGKVDNEDILGEIFSSFCIGK